MFGDGAHLRPCLHHTDTRRQSPKQTVSLVLPIPQPLAVAMDERLGAGRQPECGSPHSRAGEIVWRDSGYRHGRTVEVDRLADGRPISAKSFLPVVLTDRKSTRLNSSHLG